MEVDLTYDDMIITGPLPPSKAAASPSPTSKPSKSTPVAAPKKGRFHELHSALPKSKQQAPSSSASVPPKNVKETTSSASVAPQKGKETTSNTTVVDLVDDDDDIIIYETKEPSKDKSGAKDQRPSKISAVLQEPRPSPIPSAKVGLETNRMDVDDDIIVVLDDPEEMPVVKKNQNVPPAAASTSSSGKKQSQIPVNEESMDEGVFDEIVGIGGQVSAKGNAKSTVEKTSPQVAPTISSEKNINTNDSTEKQNNASGDVIELAEPPSQDAATKANSMPTSKHYVVDITEDDSTKKDKRKSENLCLNANCLSGEDLASAPMFVISYYGCKLLKGRYVVCAKCFEAAVNHHQILANRLLEKKSLFSYEHFPVNDITVVDLESDEEQSEPEDPLPLSALQDIEENLEQVLQETLAMVDLDYQIQEASSYLSDKMTSLELSGKKMDEEYDKLQSTIDLMRKDVYKNYEPIRKELPSLDLNRANPCQPMFKPPPPAHHIKVEQPFPRGVAMKKVTPFSKVFTPRLDGSSQDVVAVAQIHTGLSVPLPPVGNLLRPKPRANDIVYVMKMSFFGVWLRGRVIEVINNTAAGAPMVKTLYKVKMEIQANRRQFSVKTVSGHHMAYPNPAQVRLPVGTRVIAVFQDDESHNQNKGGSYYSGLIAEPPKSNNGFRYLVFFDDGYAQYVHHHKILVVCESSAKVWDDIHPDSREFIHQYLNKYPERPMVKLAPNQVVKTEWNGKWWIARVVEVDGSLVKMSFDADKRTEWIYRGSTRLAPLFSELQRGVGGTISRMRGLGMRRYNQPYVEYTQNTGVEDDTSEHSDVSVPSTIVRAVAKKSTSKRQEAPVSPIQTERPGFFNIENIGGVKELQLPKDAPMPKRYQTHFCGSQCIEWIKYDPVKMLGFNPLSVPLYCGWQRELPKYRKKSTIMYTAPCGRRLRSMEELHRYLRTTKSNMSVDLFDFDYWVNALSQFTLNDKIKKYIVQEDMSNGKENVKIPLINYVDHSLPSNLMYATQRQPFEGVPLNTKKEFLCGCDCTDDCQNKETCACWQLTIQGSSLYPGGVPDPNVGYYYKRLQERVITGIYECNPQCSCSKTTCLNRVVQHPLQLQLQLFKTATKGWGLRCVNDIPKGTFICIYAGFLYTEQTANKIGEEEGDDYLAELDYIEVVERMKEDYESDVEDDEPEEDEQPAPKCGNTSRNRNRDETDSDFKFGSRSSLDSNPDDTIRSRLRKRTAAELESGDDEKGSKRKESAQRSDHDGDDDGSDDDKSERQPSSFTPKPPRKSQVVEKSVHRFQSVRKLYGPNERVYIMDANKVGNIGRYLNHSCSPNVFVQNVFVDTHDLRFPWVAFFALTYIRAGSELTWDYNYDVGSVPDKQIICRCGSLECRGRLL